MSNIRPLYDKVLVERIEAEAKTAGGIIIPDSAQEKPSEGLIIAVGKGTKNENGEIVPLDVKVGDKILFEKWGATEAKVANKEVLILPESKILAVIE
jgi:chaperonin GroES